MKALKIFFIDLRLRYWQRAMDRANEQVYIAPTFRKLAKAKAEYHRAEKKWLRAASEWKELL